METFVDKNKKLSKFVRFGKSMIKGPVVWAASFIKDYPERGDIKVFTPFEEIEKVVKTHEEFTIIENHVYDMYDKEWNPKPITDAIGMIKDLRADPNCECGRGVAYINVNKIHSFIVNALLRGGVIGISGGGRMKKGPGGHHNGENYDISQKDIGFHHMALLTNSIPKCPVNICGFNIAESFMESLIKKIPELIPLVDIKNQGQAVAISFRESKKELEIKDKLDLKDDLPSKAFQEFYKYLVFEGTILEESCVKDFYSDFKEAWKPLEVNGIINDSEQDNSIKQNLSKNKKTREFNLTELEKLIEEIKTLKAENATLKNSKLADATKGLAVKDKQIEDLAVQLKESNKNLAEIKVFETSIKEGQMAYMKEALMKTGVYAPEDLKAITDLKVLEAEFNTAKRFNPQLVDANVIMVQQQPIQPQMPQQQMPYNPYGQQMIRPPLMPQQFANQQMPQAYPYTPQQGHSVLPMPPVRQQPVRLPNNIMAPNQMNESQPQPVKQYQKVPAGSVPTSEELYSEDNPRFKSTENEEDKDKGFI